MIKKITCEVYGQDIYIMIGKPYHKFIKQIKDKYRVILQENDIPKGCVDGAAIELDTGWLLWAQNYSLSIIAHEALHITQSILERQYIFLSKETKEVYAYYLSWILGHIEDSL